MVINDHAIASTRWLGLGSKLYPSSMPRMLNKDLTRSTQNHSTSEQAKERLCCQGVRLISVHAVSYTHLTLPTSDLV